MGVYAVAGCGADLLVNICLTILGCVGRRRPPLLSLPEGLLANERRSVVPGHIHAFYIEYVYYDRREQAREGRFAADRAPGIYSERVQQGGNGYGTIAQST